MKRVELLTKLQEIAPTYSFGEHPANAKKPYLVLIQNSWTKSPTNSFAGWSNWRVIVVNPTSLRGLDNLETDVMYFDTLEGCIYCKNCQKRAYR